ncbi:MAG TPA: efflux RND transporter periplasmic adaptor subunit [Longilinea sp.]|nr:efflux RND transporter periplasmic adaptor subunit [Longilinea sp.]
MPKNIRKFAPFIILGLLILAGVWYVLDRATHLNEDLIVSGTVEAVQVRLAPELSGRVVEVLVEESQTVSAGDALVRLDDTLLQAQRSQAAAALAAAQANLDMLAAGPSAEQLAVAQAALDAAQVAVDAAVYPAQIDQTEAALNTAQANYDLVAAGARPQQIDAAQAQVDAAQAALDILDIQIGKLTITAPIDGVVLERAIEPGEIAAAGSTVILLGDLSSLTLTVYVPEDQYGIIALGDTFSVSVDSYPDVTFQATVTRVADQAEFTPRNVQTTQSRMSTVYAIELSVDDPQGMLRPGMPADVNFSSQP